MADTIPSGNIRDSVTHVVGLPRVCGLALDCDLDVRVSPASPSTTPSLCSLMDGGAKICLTGTLDLLVGVESIPPLPILVATKTGVVLLDDYCTKKGLLPLTLADGSVIIAKMLWKPSYRLRPSWPPAMFWSDGHKLVIKMDVQA